MASCAVAKRTGKVGGNRPSSAAEGLIRSIERKLEALREEYTIPCPHCGQPILASMFASAAAKRSASMRKTLGAGSGRPAKLTPCPKCGQQFGVAELRRHKPHCKGR
ncbi:MAG: hypothetical protein EPO02_13010 [Nitrospirae bacterium]|nr:MAG: hypothetical protein EPO02_13010 [Nitrospirota bacterium]